MTKADKYYLKGNVRVRPLMNRWPALVEYISPLTQGMRVRNHCIPIMESYLEDPAVHVAAAREPLTMGGPWLDHPVEASSQVRHHLTRTRDVQKPLLELTDAYIAFDDYIQKNAHGGSMVPLYQDVPDVLRGFIELVYDLNCHPAIRIIEPLLYRSRYYDRSLHNFAFHTVDNDTRCFQEATPVLDSPERLILNVPFEDSAVDDVLQSRTISTHYSDLAATLGVKRDTEAVFRSLITADAPPQRYTPPPDGHVRIRYMGHACVLVEYRGISLLTDPFLSYDYPSPLQRYTYRDLPAVIDFALITHAHSDHTDLETLFNLRQSIARIILGKNGNGKLQDPCFAKVLMQIGFPNVTGLAELEEVQFDGGYIMALPFLGEHSDLDIQDKRGYLINIRGRRILFLADSMNIESQMYKHLQEVLGDIDVLFIGMECEGAPLSWAYGSLLSQPLDRAIDQTRTVAGSDCAQALGIVKALHVKQAYVYAMNREPWLNHVLAMDHSREDSRRVSEPRAFITECRAMGLIADQPYLQREILLPVAKD